MNISKDSLNKKSPDGAERARFIRKGNELFNQGRLKEAIQIFLKADYKDGLARVGDHFLYDRKEPVNALSFYRKACHKKGIRLIIQNIVTTIRTFMRADKYSEQWHEYVDSNFPDSAAGRKQGLKSPDPEQSKPVVPVVLGAPVAPVAPVAPEEKVEDLEKLRKELENK